MYIDSPVSKTFPRHVGTFPNPSGRLPTPTKTKNSLGILPNCIAVARDPYQNVFTSLGSLSKYIDIPRYPYHQALSSLGLPINIH